MRRSFGGRGMGGGSGGVIRTVQRAVSAGSPSAARNLNNKQPSSPNAVIPLHSNASNNNNGTSAFSSLINLPISATSAAVAPSSSLICRDEPDWECVDGTEDQRAHVFYEDFVFGTVPSTDEVHHAVSALQQVFGPSSYNHFPKGKLVEDIDRDVADEVANTIGFETIFSSAEAETDSIESSPRLCNSKTMQPHGSDRVYDVFHLLQTEPSVQRMVISLSSDKAVWDAVLNNEVVKELRGSIHQAESILGESSGEGSGGSNPVNDILSWIIVNVKAKIMQLVDRMAKLVNEYFQPLNEEKKRETTDPSDEKLKTSLLLSIIVLFVVIISRVQGA